MQFIEKELYEAFIARIKAKASHFTDNSHVPPVHYDWDREQYEVDGDRDEIPFMRPAIFIRFGEIDITSRTGTTMRASIPVTITCAQDKYVDAMDGSSNQPEYLKLLEWKYLVNDILNEFKPACAGTAYLQRIDTDHVNRNLHVEKLNYTIQGTFARNNV